MFEIRGGIHTDTTFTKIVPGTEEHYGPFESYRHAVNVWRGKMGANIDICEHRLFVNKVREPIVEWRSEHLAERTH